MRGLLVIRGRMACTRAAGATSNPARLKKVLPAALNALPARCSARSRAAAAHSQSSAARAPGGTWVIVGLVQMGYVGVHRRAGYKCRFPWRDDKVPERMLSGTCARVPAPPFLPL